MKRIILMLVAGCLMLSAGCSTVGEDATPAAAESEIGVNVPDTLPKAASIPELEFVLASDVPGGEAIEPGAALAANSYKPAATGADLTSVQWVIGEDDGIRRLMLSLQFNEAGTKQVAKLTRDNLEKRVLIVLGGRVVGNMSAGEPLETGAVTLTSPDVLAARPEIDAAVVPFK